jgi:hypothetical protein
MFSIMDELSGVSYLLRALAAKGISPYDSLAAPGYTDELSTVKEVVWLITYVFHKAKRVNLRSSSIPRTARC